MLLKVCFLIRAEFVLLKPIINYFVVIISDIPTDQMNIWQNPPEIPEFHLPEVNRFIGEFELRLRTLLNFIKNCITDVP